MDRAISPAAFNATDVVAPTVAWQPPPHEPRGRHVDGIEPRQAPDIRQERADRLAELAAEQWLLQAGDHVRIVACRPCSSLVGRVATVRDVRGGRVWLHHGRGRPPRCRPLWHAATDLEPVATPTAALPAGKDATVNG